MSVNQNDFTEECMSCLNKRESNYFCIICDKTFCNSCVESLKQLCTNCSNILILKDKTKELSLKEYFAKENNIDNYVKMIKSMNIYLSSEKEKLNEIELIYNEKEKLINDQKDKINLLSKKENNIANNEKSNKPNQHKMK